MSEGITEKQAEKEEEDLFEIEDELNENLSEKENDLESYGGAVDAMTKSTVEEDATKEATVDGARDDGRSRSPIRDELDTGSVFEIPGTGTGSHERAPRRPRPVTSPACSTVPAPRVRGPRLGRGVSETASSSRAASRRLPQR